MKRRRIELSLLLITLLLFPVAAFAQDDMTFGEDEVESSGDDMTFDGGDDDGGGQDDAAATETESSDDDLIDLDDLGMGEGSDIEVGVNTDAKGKKASKEVTVLDRHPIWAIQQVYALRKHRLDLQPSFGISLNDPYVQHQSFNLGAAFYLTEVLSIGVNFNWYTFFNAETDVNYSISRATHQTVPINEYSWGAQLNMTYVPIYGKFAMFKQWIVHWDVWLIGGAGFIFTRPISVIDPEYRTFDYEMKVAFNIGIGGRLFLTRFLAISLELRDYMFPEKVESLITYKDPALRADSDNWMDPDVKFTNNVTLQIGISLFVPFTFDFKLPK